MFRSLSLSRPWVSCFEGEGGAGDGAGAGLGAGAGAGAAAGAGASAGAGAGATAAAGETRFTQEDLNRFLAEDRRKHQVQLQKMESQLNELAKSKSLTEQERQTLKENLDAIAGQLRTKEQQATLEKRQLEEQYQVKVQDAEKKAQVWEALFRDSTIDRSLQDAAVKHEAFNPAQVVTQLRPWTRMIEVMDEKAGKPTGKYKPVVDMPDVDATTNEQVIMTRSPEEAVKRMKEMPEQWGNLFRSNVVSGIGSSSATGGLMPGYGGKVDVRKLTPQQYREIREKNPELLGLAPKRR
jgi:hypothetical protein